MERKWDEEDEEEESDDEKDSGRLCCCCCGAKTGTTLIAVLQIFTYGSCLVISLAVGIHLISVTLLLRFVDDSNRSRLGTLVAHPNYDDENYAQNLLLEFGVAQPSSIDPKYILWAAIILFSLCSLLSITLLVGVLKSSALLLRIWIWSQIFGLTVFLVAQFVCHFFLEKKQEALNHSASGNDGGVVVEEDGGGRGEGGGGGFNSSGRGVGEEEDRKFEEIQPVHNLKFKIFAFVLICYFIIVVYAHYRKLNEMAGNNRLTGRRRRLRPPGFLTRNAHQKY